MSDEKGREESRGESRGLRAEGREGSRELDRHGETAEPPSTIQDRATGEETQPSALSPCLSSQPSALSPRLSSQPSALSPQPSSRPQRYAAAAFLTLLLLSIFWPSPVVSANRLWLQQPLDVDELSFLGREAPQWDVVFWFFAGVLLLAIVFSAEREANPREPLMQLRAWRFGRSHARDALAGLALGIALTAVAWLLLDTPVVTWAESIQSETTEDVVRIFNRLGGGMNPVLIVAFFLIAGVAYRDRRWVAHALAMGAAGLGAGLVAQIIKHLVGRARPELWLGPMHYAPGSSTSFPSGHTVGAFALAGVLVFGARSRTLRIAALALAAGVGLSRILAFRHWMSDVTASAVIGLVAAWILTRVSLRHVEGAEASGDV